VVDWMRNLQIPEELRQNYGYAEVTSEIRAGILGLNLARLTGIEPTRRVGKDAEGRQPNHSEGSSTS